MDDILPFSFLDIKEKKKKRVLFFFLLLAEKISNVPGHKSPPLHILSIYPPFIFSTQPCPLLFLLFPPFLHLLLISNQTQQQQTITSNGRVHRHVPNRKTTDLPRLKPVPRRRIRFTLLQLLPLLRLSIYQRHHPDENPPHPSSRRRPRSPPKRRRLGQDPTRSQIRHRERTHRLRLLPRLDRLPAVPRGSSSQHALRQAQQPEPPEQHALRSLQRRPRAAPGDRRVRQARPLSR